MVRSRSRILHVRLVQINTEMAEKYANQRYAVSVCVDLYMGYWAWGASVSIDKETTNKLNAQNM